MGKAMIDYATEGDLKNFKRLFQESDDKELMYWHVQKGFKAAVKNK
jgi:succinate dehydrogenase flavin-adding protein (antitoxin of CptAB toxin-antitoxin module)